MHKLENGIHDIPNEVYHGSEGISRSALMEFKRSPYHYWYKHLSGNSPKQQPSPAMKIGEYVHALVLEPKFFHERYIVEPQLMDVPKLGLLKELGRDEYDRLKTQREAVLCANELTTDLFSKSAEGKEIITVEAFNQANTIAEAVLCNEVARDLFDGVKVEQSIYFTHKETGLQCKVRPDAWLGSVVTDLKTCADASFYGFQSAAYRCGYFLQAAMVKCAFESIGFTLDKFIFFCVEKSPGFPCVYYPVDDEAMYRGELEFSNLMIRLSDCLNSGQWDSYESQSLCYPKYALYEE